MIPIICGILNRLGGCGRDDYYLPFPPFNLTKCVIAGNAWRGIVIPIVIALHMKSIWYFVSYFFAFLIFGYGESHPIRKWFGFNVACFLYGFAVGLASFSFLWGVFCGGVFLGLMYLSNKGIDRLVPNQPMMTTWYLDHAILEVSFGFLATLIYLWK